MKLLLITVLFAFSSFVIQAQDLLFSKEMAAESPDDPNYAGGPFRWLEVEEIGTPEKPLAVAIIYEQSYCIPETETIKLFSLKGDLLQEIVPKSIVESAGILGAGKSFSSREWTFGIQSLGNSDGSFCLTCQNQLGSIYAIDVFFAYQSGKWVETNRIVFDYRYRKSITSHYTGQRGERRYDFFGYGKPINGKIYVDVYVSNLSALNTVVLPVASITSSLSSVTLRKDRLMSNYTTTTNFGANLFSAVNLPPGVKINGTTGVISGVPTLKGVYVVTINASKDGKSVVTALKKFSVL